MKRQFCIVLVTAPSLKAARVLAKSCLKSRLAACVNLIPIQESHYWWEGKLETGREILLVIKTRRALLTELERRVRQEHPYETPEFIEIPINSGSRKYLDWIALETSPQKVSS